MKFEPVIKWSGSKRYVSEEIISHFPKQIDIYYEPFCGGCSILFQLLNSDIQVNKYVCSDANEDLILFFNTLKNNPIFIYNEYKKRWNKLKSYESLQGKKEYYNMIRSEYNRNHNIHDFIFLTRTCINGLIRYNSKGEFNSSFHLNRDGINPERFKKIIFQWSNKLNEKDVIFIHCNYTDIKPKKNDYVFLDPPYANTNGDIYNGVIDYNEFWLWLSNLNCNYSFTFDGKKTRINKTYDIPLNIYNKHIYLTKGNSSFKRLQNDNDYTSESLYIKQRSCNDR